MVPLARARLTLTTGAIRSWAWPGGGWIGNSKPIGQIFSWTADGTTLAFQQRNGSEGALSLSFLAAVAGTLAAVVLTGILVRRCVRVRRADLLAWTIAATAITIALAAYALGAYRDLAPGAHEHPAARHHRARHQSGVIQDRNAHPLRPRHHPRRPHREHVHPDPPRHLPEHSDRLVNASHGSGHPASPRPGPAHHRGHRPRPGTLNAPPTAAEAVALYDRPEPRSGVDRPVYYRRRGRCRHAAARVVPVSGPV